ncbi:hypothetical protein Vretimale_4476, partial [Volvox reticuliferus]
YKVILSNPRTIAQGLWAAAMWPTATALGSLGRVRFAPADHHHARKQEGLLLFSISSAHIPSRVTKCAGQVSGESALAQSFESALLQAQQQAGPRQHTQDLQIEISDFRLVD